jgi:SAM-dependent methyltransferase
MVDELKREFNKRKPWVTQFVIQEQVFGGSYDATSDPRLKWFQDHFPDAQNILELGSLEGGHSFALASQSHINQVVAVEGRADNLERARFVQQELKQSKVKFVHANLERLDLSCLGKFDVVFCVGLLYHLPRPWKLVEQMSRVARSAYI